jgi:hypothetical protein
LSQRRSGDRMIDTGEYRPTLRLNGYGNFIAGMYT